MALPTLTIVGNIKRMEISQTASGKQITRFQIECSEKNAKGEWTNLYLGGEVWEKASEFMNKWFKEGDAIIATGKLYTNSYKNKDDKTVYETKLLFPDISFVPKSKEQSNTQEPSVQAYQAPQASYEKQEVPEIDIDDENIPFSEVSSTYTQSYK